MLGDAFPTIHLDTRRMGRVAGSRLEIGRPRCGLKQRCSRAFHQSERLQNAKPWREASGDIRNGPTALLSFTAPPVSRSVSRTAVVFESLLLDSSRTRTDSNTSQAFRDLLCQGW